MVSGRAVKERKERKEGERQLGWERKTPASAQGLRVNLGRAVAVSCFPGCDSGELGIKPTRLSWVFTSSVRNERDVEEAEKWLKHQLRVYCLGRSPVEGDPSKRAGAPSCL
jgi:hypothetical protein